MERSPGSHRDKVEKVGVEDSLLGPSFPPAAAAGGQTTPETAVMPVSDVMTLLQAMREEQLDSLKRIADGVQQLQSQVMVLGESASASEGNISTVLSRLAALEVRIGSIPVPMKPPDTIPPYRTQPQAREDFGAVGGSGGAIGGVARIPAFGASAQAGSATATPGKVPPPPPSAAAEPRRVPTWRAEPEPPRPHFMRNTSPKPRASPANTTSSLTTAAPAVAPVKAVSAATAEPGGGGGDAGISSEEAARKEANRLAFMQDRARIQARIAAMKGGGEAPTDAKPVPTSTNAPKPEAEKQGTVQKHSLFDSPPAKAPAVGLSSPFGTSGAGSGVFAGSSSFLDRDNKANTGDEAADWLEREKEQRDQRERARREEEERVEQQRAEAKRLKEEEETRKIRQAEDARAREKARREAEAKKKEKTRVLMSSLFDKEEDDGNSLFSGLGGATLPVFTNESNSHNDYTPSSSGGAEQASKIPVAPASSVSTFTSPPPSSGGSLFGGIDEPTASRGKSDTPGSPFSQRVSSTIGGLQPARKGDSGGGMFSDAQPTTHVPAAQAGERVGAESSDIGAESGGLFDSLPLPSEADNNPAAPTEKASDEIDDFFSTLESAGASTTSGGGNSEPSTARGPIFGQDVSAADGSEDDIFASPFSADTNQGAEGRGGTASSDSAGYPGPAGRAGTSLFDRAEFSIDSAGKDGDLFGVGGGDGGKETTASFLSAMGGDDGSVRGRGGGGVGEQDEDKEGMVEVSF